MNKFQCHVTTQVPGLDSSGCFLVRYKEEADW
jgi:hypothetical protein